MTTEQKGLIERIEFTLSRLKETIAEQREEIEKIQKELEKKRDKIIDLEDTLSEQEQEGDPLESLFPAPTVPEVIKRNIFARLHRNISLEQAEAIEQGVKDTNKNYVDLLPE